jgi:large subunit ribosomal protein L29
MASKKEKATKAAAPQSGGKSSGKGGGRTTGGSKVAVARTKLRAKGDAELRDELITLRREQFNLRMQRATGQSAKPDQWSKVRRNIARIKTLLGERAAKTAADAGAKG